MCCVYNNIYCLNISWFDAIETMRTKYEKKAKKEKNGKKILHTK